MAEIESSVAAIAQSVVDLSESVSTLTEDLSGQVKRLTLLSKAVAAGVVMVFALSVGIGFSGWQSTQNAQRIDEIQVSRSASAARNSLRLEGQANAIADLQRRTSEDVLCPLYRIFLQAYNPKSPQALADPAAYEETFRVISEGAKTLGCPDTIPGLGDSD